MGNICCCASVERAQIFGLYKTELSHGQIPKQFGVIKSPVEKLTEKIDREGVYIIRENVGVFAK